MGTVTVLNTVMGKKKNYNQYNSEIYSALINGYNCIIEEVEGYKPRQGFNLYATETTNPYGSASLKVKLHSGKNYIFITDNSLLWKDNGSGNFYYIANIDQPDINTCSTSFEQNEYMFFNGKSWNLKVHNIQDDLYTTSSGYYDVSGMDRPTIMTTSASGTSGALRIIPNGYHAYYNATIRKLNRNGTEVVSASLPTAFRCLNNTGSDYNAIITVYLPKTAKAGNIVDIYRTKIELAATTPSPIYKLVKSYTITSTDITNKYISIEDDMTDALREYADELYTDSSQEGQLYENEIPPLCKTMFVHRGHAVYCNTWKYANVFINLIDPSLITAGDTITFTLSSGTTKTITAHGSTTDATRFAIATGGTATENIENTAKNIVRCLALSNAPKYISAWYISTAYDAPGQIKVFIDRGSNVLSKLDDDFSVTCSSAGISAAFSPAIPTNGTTYSSTKNEQKHGIQSAKENQAEHCPPAFEQFLEDSAAEITCAECLGESSYIATTKGIYLMTGAEPPFSIIQLDATLDCDAPNSLIKMDGKLYLYSDHGWMEISSSGIKNISRDLLKSHLSVPLDSTSLGNIVGCGYHPYNSMIISWPTTQGSTTRDKCEVYSTMYDAWLEWSTIFESAVNHKGVMYYAPPLDITNPNAPIIRIYKMRKGFVSTDYRDPDQSMTISGIDTTTKEITFTGNTTELRNTGKIVQGAITVNVTSQTVLNKVIVDSTTGLTNGACTLITGVKAYVDYIGNFCGQGGQAMNKIANRISFLFDTEITSIKIAYLKTTTDLNSTLYYTPIGGETAPTTGRNGLIPFYLPEGYNSFRVLYPGFYHDTPDESFLLYGYTLDYSGAGARPNI